MAQIGSDLPHIRYRPSNSARARVSVRVRVRTLVQAMLGPG